MKTTFYKIEFKAVKDGSISVERLEESDLTSFAGKTIFEKLINRTASKNRSGARKQLSSVTQITIEPIYGSPSKSLDIK